MAPNIFQTGNQVDVYEQGAVIDGVEGVDGIEALQSRICGRTENGGILLEMPVRDGIPVILEQGARYGVCVHGENGSFGCVVQIKDRFRRDNLFLMEVERKSGCRRMSPARFFAMEKLFQVKYAILRDRAMELAAEAAAESGKPIEWEEGFFEGRNALAVELGGDGCRLVMSEEAKKGSLLLLSIERNGGSLSFLGRVTENLSARSAEGRFENRVRFIHVGEDRRRELVLSIFEEERKSRVSEKS